MQLIRDVLNTLPDARVEEIRVGVHWTSVVVELNGNRSCGLASTVNNEQHQEGVPDVEHAGRLTEKSALELAEFSFSQSMIESSIGIAAINALIQPHPEQWVEINAEHIIARYGEGKKAAVIGRFPFVERLRSQVGELFVFDLHPGEGEYSPTQVPEILPAMNVVAITGMTLVNKTLDNILPYCKPDSLRMMLGPSTFLSPVLYDYGFQLISGAYVEKIDPALKAMSEGGTFKQVHRAGVRLVTMSHPSLLH